jgi:hypothetical protein
MTDFYSSTKPIPMKYTPSKYSFNNPDDNYTEYIYNLFLVMKDGTEQNFVKIINKTFVDLISIADGIDYNNIESYSLEISKLIFENVYFFKLDEKFNNTTNNYSKRTEKIYIEFTQNSNNMTICKCYFIGVDFNSILISPPN